MNYAQLQTAKALHDDITKQAANIESKVYLFFDEIQEVADWEKCVNSLPQAGNTIKCMFSGAFSILNHFRNRVR